MPHQEQAFTQCSPLRVSSYNMGKYKSWKGWTGHSRVQWAALRSDRLAVRSLRELKRSETMSFTDRPSS